MNQSLRYLLDAILRPQNGATPLGGVDFEALPPGGTSDALRSFARSIGDHESTHKDRTGSDPTHVLARGAASVAEELESLYRTDKSFSSAVDEAASVLRKSEPISWTPDTRETLWRVFFPEGVGLDTDREAQIAALRKRREVEITRLNPSPIKDPASEILFTSNVLITVPSRDDDVSQLPYSPELKERIRATMGEVQLYYYDHPIHIGVQTDHNEAIYGMRGLDQAIEWEKTHRGLDNNVKASVVLSLSVTHEGLRTVAREYLLEEFRRGGPFTHLEIYLLTELECRALIEETMAPYLSPDDARAITEVFGVDGEYGRHYSVLKAIAALWSSLIDPGVRGTFKIDLDQVFPQDELSSQADSSALEHFTSPLWGAEGTDSQGTPVRLGMIAGSLVNERDISRGLFTPDVPFPEEIPAGEAVVFYNKLPMALSTEAEMMTRYNGSGIDGASRCLMRYHVTGGTNGILVEDLRRYRPFTPTFVGRAEDQAFLLSVLYEGNLGLRYLHKPGLIMRHDKEAFAGESIAAATDGRFVGDLARTWIFSRYVETLPWGFDRTKEQIDPFTGCFATKKPLTLMFLRLVLYCAAILVREPDGDQHVEAILDLADRKLSPLFEDPDGIARAYSRQRNAWDTFYRAIEVAAGSSESTKKAREIIERSRLV